MKTWHEYQLKNQVKNFDWSEYSKPILNILDADPRAKIAFKSIKQKFYDNQYTVEKRRYPNPLLYKLIAKNIGDPEITEAVIEEWMMDPKYARLREIQQLTIFQPKDKEDLLLRDILKNHINVDHRTMRFDVHVQEPGENLYLHIDRPKNADWGGKPGEEPIYTRYMVFFDDWASGQFFQMGDDFIKWRAGDIYVWNARDVPHASANMGFDPRFAMMIDGKLTF